MTETVELVDQPVVASAAAETARPHRLFQVAAWAAIVAGTLASSSRRFSSPADSSWAGTAGITGTAMGMGVGRPPHSMQGGFGGPGMMPPWGRGWAGMGQMGPVVPVEVLARARRMRGNPAGPSTTVPSRP